MKTLTTLILLLNGNCFFAQVDLLKAGDKLPDLIIKNISNAPVKEIAVNDRKDKKILILNFWGTWCSPCILEMDALAKLQKANEKTIRVIAISDDSPERLKKYNTTKPSTLWLAADTSYFLYRLFGFASVGHCAIIGNDYHIIALVKTDSVNQAMIDKLSKAESILSSANITETLINTCEDGFGVDSLTKQSFTIRGYMNGKRGMSMEPNEGLYANRRISYFNTCGSEVYRRAFKINSPSQLIYEMDKKEVCDFENKQSLFCVDILVKPEDQDSLHSILQKKLLLTMPFKARIEYRKMPVYVLKVKEITALNFRVSTSTKSSYGFSGRGYEGTAVLLSEFADNYLTNELGIPVVDETGLTARYDIKTENDLRTGANTKSAVEKLGLMLEKAERTVKVIVFYR